MRKIVCVAALALLSACSESGSEYIGKWVNSESSSTTMEISRNGENFLIKETTPVMWGKKGETNTSTGPAVMKDGMLHVQGALGTPTISHIKQNDTLAVTALFGTREYKRAK